MSVTNEPPVLNVPLLRKTLEHIEAHPDDWNQCFWRGVSYVAECGTAMCFAGWACELAGGVWAGPASDFMWGDMLIAEPDDPTELAVRFDESVCIDPPADAIIDPGGRATRLLGLTGEQGNDLFDANNSLDDIRRHLRTITNGEVGA